MSARKRREQREKFDLEPSSLSLEEADKALFGEINEADALVPSVEQAIVNRGRGIVEIGKFRLSPIGMEFSSDVSFEEWTAFFEALRRIQTSLQWIIGDWVAFGENKLERSYEDMATLTGYKEKTLREYAYVSRNVPMSIRMDTLSFGHHQVVAALPQPSQESWLQYATLNKLSVAKLRDEISGSPTPPPADPLGVKNFSKNARYVSRLVDRVGEAGEISQRDADKVLDNIDSMRKWLDAAESLIRKQKNEKPKRKARK